MDSLHLSLRSKSSSGLKNKPSLIKELQKIAKQVTTPTSRRSLLKNVIVPQTTRASATGKSYENSIKKFKTSNSHSNLSIKKSSTKSSSKTPSKDSKLKSSKHLSEPSLSGLKKSTDGPIRLPLTPKSSIKLVKSSPKALTSAKKLFNLLTKEKIIAKQPKKSIKAISSRTCTGTINGKPKPNNQDEMFILPNFAQCKAQSLIGVLDGHGIYGHEVSAFVKRQLPLMIENNLPYEGKFHIVTSSSECSTEILQKIEKALVQGFMNTHKALINKRIIDINYSGTTAVSVLIRDKHCICSNVGDSRAVIGRFDENWYPVELSQDHKPSDKSERARIEEAGGRVEPFKESGGQFIGPDRVWLQHEQLPGLAMSRSIGDLVAAHVGVISEPEVIVHEITPQDKILIIATDGIWEFISSYNCIQFLSQYYEKGNIEEACDALLQHAISKWNAEDNVVDDITFIVVFLN